MKKLIERLLIKVLKSINVDLLPHAHVQIGVGHNTYCSGEEHVVDHVIENILNGHPKLIFDVGANIGSYAQQLSNRFPDSIIHCFEPIPNTFSVLENNTKGLNTINVMTAVGSSPGQLQLFIGDNNTDGSMASSYKESLETMFPHVGEVKESYTVPVITLDEYCANIKGDIDFLKIDVEGHEIEVLRGASKLIENNRINIIQFEFNEFNIFSKTYMRDFYQTLNNYDFFRILPSNQLLKMGNYSSSLEIFKYQNVLAINKKLIQSKGFKTKISG